MIERKSVRLHVNASAAVVMPVGPGQMSALDTLDSIKHYCREPHIVVIVDDCTSDGTYEAIISRRMPNWHILRNVKPMGVSRLVQTLSRAYRYVHDHFRCNLVFRLDQDALLIKGGILSDALGFAHANPEVGLFGVYERDYNRPRSFDAHRKLIKKETSWFRRIVGYTPYWVNLLAIAETNGYKAGDNVFGGAYFMTGRCLEAINASGALDVPYRWNSRLMEDVYFSMATVSCGLHLGHFAAPDGPLCLEWRGLPYPANVLAESHYKVIHSVDKGRNTGRDSNDGMTAREVFLSIRQREHE